MRVSRSAGIWLEYHRYYSRETTLESDQAAPATVLAEFAGRQIGDLSIEDVLSHLNRINAAVRGAGPATCLSNKLVDLE